ncbi:hypothetical protein [Agrobacterium sp. CG674]
MNAGQFFTHATGISAAIQVAIGLYCRANDIPWDAKTFKEESPHDLEEIAKDALFYGAETFPDAASTDH